MFCKNCGNELKDSARFCSKCGQEVTPPVFVSPLNAATAPQTKPAPHRNNKKLLIIVIIAVAVVAALVIGLIVYNLSINPGNKTTEDDYITEEVFSDKPEGNEPPFEIGESGFLTNDPNIKMIEVNQSLSYGFDTDTGKLYLMDKFVAGKETAIFIDLENPVSPDSEITLEIKRNGEYVATLLPYKMLDEKTILFQPKDIAEADNWGQGAYTFTLRIDASTAIRTTNFFDTMVLKVLGVPVLANYSGRIVSCLDDWKNGATMITATYPVAKANVDFVLAPELDLSASRYDLDTEDGQFYVWEALKNLQTPANDYTLIVGFIRYPANNGQFLGYTYGLPANVVCESEPDLYATVVHEIAHCYLIGDEYSGGSLNNELNAPPYRMPGHDIVTRQPTEGNKEAVIGGFSVGINGSGSIIYPQQRAYWVEGREMLTGLTSYMGSGTGEDSFKFWTTSDIWNHLFSAFTGLSDATLGGEGSGGDSGGGAVGGVDGFEYWGQCFNCYSDVYDPDFYIQCLHCYQFTEVTVVDDGFTCYGCGTRWSLNDYTGDGLFIDCASCDYLLQYDAFVQYNSGAVGKKASEEPAYTMVTEVTGYIETDGTFTADPWYSYTVPEDFMVENKDGEYSVRVYDAKGKTVAVTYFDAVENGQITTAKEGQQFEKGMKIPINVAVKYPDSAAKIVIQKGDEELYARGVSKNAPTVSFTSVIPDKENEDLVTVAWEASDADGDELFFRLYYCTDEDNYYSIASNITDSSYTVDLTDHTGSEKGYFYIYATDGVNTEEAFSEYFKVSYTAPFFINEYKEGLSCKITEELIFDPQAYDNQDGWLGWDSVTWYVNGEHYMDSPDLWILPYQVSAGTHIFTCVATNSAGLKASRDFTVEIIDDESDLPDDWSRDDVRHALMSGFYLPLDRLDAPVTRSQFARQMVFVYGAYSSLPEIYPYFDREGLVTDCGDDDLFEAMMVYLGVMDAPDGLFEPNKSMTEREGAIIMYKLAIMADDQDKTSDDFDEEEILAELVKIGVLDKDGPNILEPDNKLSGKTTLVRLGKLFRYSFED